MTSDFLFAQEISQEQLYISWLKFDYEIRLHESNFNYDALLKAYLKHMRKDFLVKDWRLEVV